jgi:hypothetical protein
VAFEIIQSWAESSAGRDVDRTRSPGTGHIITYPEALLGKNEANDLNILIYSCLGGYLAIFSVLVKDKTRSDKEFDRLRRFPG